MTIAVDNIKRYDWRLSVMRPSTLLERALRCRGHGLIGLKHILVISADGVCQNYIDSNEWESVIQRIKKIIAENKLKAEILRYRNIFSAIKPLNKDDPEYFFNVYAKITEMNVFRRFLEAIMEKDEQLRSMADEIAGLHNDARLLKDRLYDDFINLSDKRIEWFLPEEIISFIKNDKAVSDKVITARKKKYLGWYEDGQFSITTDKNIIHSLESFLKKSVEINAGKITGSGVYPGICRGRVRIVRHIKNLEKLKLGEIIACSMFEPRMATLSAHAKAIITDEGGITCHAVVISREMKVPCVIGTKIATQVLKDGDLVEVDADAGEIRKL